MSDQEQRIKEPKQFPRTFSEEYYLQKNKLKEAVNEKVQAQLKRLDPIQRLVYDFIFNNIFVDDNMKVMLISLRDDLANTNPIAPLYNFVSGWVHGLVDAVKGNKNLSTNESNGHFIRSVIDQVGFDPLVDVHIHIMCEFIWTQDQIKLLEETHRVKPS